MKNRCMLTRQCFVLLAFSAVLSIGPIAAAQATSSSPAQASPAATPQDDLTNRSDRHDDRNNDLGELANFDGFLDKHPEIAEQLRKDPSLADNKDFLKNHPALQQFLQQHVGVRDQLEQNPNAFMRQENRYDRYATREDWRKDQGELDYLNGFLEKHPEIAEQLRKDPSLADNQNFLKNHPALQQFLQQHDGVREQFEQDPNAFMRLEDRYDRDHDQDTIAGSGKDSRGNGTGRDRDTTRAELANMDHFLDNHREISSQLTKNPELATNREYLENHPELQQYLKDHPAVNQELAENPHAFMNSMRQSNGDGEMSKGTTNKGTMSNGTMSNGTMSNGTNKAPESPKQ